MENQKENKFLQGYACCLSAAIEMEGCANTPHKELYSAGFGNRTERELQNAGVEQSDIDIFKREGFL